MNFRVLWVSVFIGGCCLSGVACSFAPVRPCSSGGQLAHDQPVEGVTVKKCTQVTDSETGQLVNDGLYYEWYSNDSLAVEGEYKVGKKTGRWIEYDLRGNKISDRYFLNGKEVSRP